jgi:hypothetical protein
MAMSNAGMSSKIKAELQDLFGSSVSGYDGLMQDFCDAMGKAIVEYIQDNAEVASTGTVTAGIASGDPVATDGTVT